MMAIDSRQIQSGELIDLSRCFEASDRTIERNRIQRRMLAESAVRVSSDSPWFAVRVTPGREMIVEKVLTEASVEALVPIRLGPIYRRRGRLIPASSLPVILGYVLVRCAPSDDAIAGVLGVESVLGFVGGNEKPHPISAEEISKFNEKAIAGHYDWEVPASVFRIGIKVRVKEGPFAGIFTGVIVSCRDDGKGDAVVELSMFGRVVPVLVPIAILDPL